MRVGKEQQIKSLVTILKRFHKHKGNVRGNMIKGNIKKPNDQSSKSQIKKQYQPINSVRLYEQSAKNNKTQVNEIKKILCVQQFSHQDSLSHKNSVFLFDTINNKSKNTNPRTDLTQNQIVMGEHARRYGIFYRQNGHKNDKGKQIQNDSFLSTHKPRIKSQVTESIFYKKSKEFKNLGASPFTNSIIKSPKNSPILIESQYSGKYSKSKKNKSPLTPTLVAEMLSVPLGLNKSSTPGLNRYSPLNSQLRMNNYQKYCQSIYQKYRDKSNQRLKKSYKIYEQSDKSELKNKNKKIFYTEQHKKTIQRNKRNIKIWQLNQNPLEKIKYIDLTKRSSKKQADQWLKNDKQQKDNKNLQQVYVDSFNTSQLKPMLPQKEQTVSQTIKQKLNKRYDRATPKLYTQLPSDSMIKSKNKTEKAAEEQIYIQTQMKLEGWQQNRRNNLPYVGKFNFEGSRANSTSLEHNFQKNSLFC